MKKLMLAVLVGLMVFATASIAAAEITVGGNMEIRYDLWNNLDLNKNFNENTMPHEHPDLLRGPHPSQRRCQDNRRPRGIRRDGQR